MGKALRMTQNALYKEYTVAPSDTATEGEAVLLDSDTTVDDCDAASDLAIGVAMETKSAGEQVKVALFGHAIIGVLVGTGGATRGKKAQLTSDGFKDASTHDSDGTGNESTYGQFLETRSAGQFVALLIPGGSNRGV